MRFLLTLTTLAITFIAAIYYKMTLAPIILPALSSKGARSTLIFLHGLGDSGHGWSQSLHSSLSTSFPSLKIVLPNAESRPFRGGQPMPQWFDIKAEGSRDKPELQDVEGMEKTREMLEKMIKAERDEGRKVVLGGFSQGWCRLYLASERGKRWSEVESWRADSSLSHFSLRRWLFQEPSFLSTPVFKPPRNSKDSSFFQASFLSSTPFSLFVLFLSATSLVRSRAHVLLPLSSPSPSTRKPPPPSSAPLFPFS